MVPNPLPLAWLPNQAGFRFLGYLRSGGVRECEVVLRPTGAPGVRVHTVEGFADLRGWRHLPAAAKG